MIIKNEKGSFSAFDIDHRRRITKVKGGWNKNKIKKELQHKKSDSFIGSFHKEICRFDTPEEFANNLFYHGSARHISTLKPSISLKMSEHFSGGSGEQYYSISLSKCRETASNFTSTSNSGNVAPVLIKRGSIIKEMPEISDSSQLEDIIEDLWNEGVDAVILGGSFTHKRGEQEVAILNPTCISVGKNEHFPVFNKPKTPSFTTEELENMWLNASEKYKEESLKSWDQHNESFKTKYGKEKDPAHRWTTKQENLCLYHQHNIESYNKNLELKQSQETKDFLKNKSKPNITNTKKNKI